MREVRFGDFQPLWVKITNGDDFHHARLFHLCRVVFPHIESTAIADDSADVQFSTLAAATKPRWFILGTDGAIVSEQNHFRVTFFVHGYRAETTVPYRQSAWHEFYRNVVNHLLHGEELVIKPEQARRVIAIMEYAERSARQGGKALALPYET